jgi:hypothetical protein
MMTVVDTVFLTAGVIGVIAAPLLLIYGIPYLQGFSHGVGRKIGLGSLVALVISVLVVFGAAEISQDVAEAEVKMKLESLGDNSRVSIDDAPAQNTNEVLSALKTLDRLPVHHSNPTKKIKIEVSSQGDSLVLLLARDSGDPREYWVFYPKYFITRSNEIGRIKTPLLDAY